MERDTRQLQNSDGQNSPGSSAGGGLVPGKRTLVGEAGESASVQRKQSAAPVSSDVRAFHDGSNGIQAQKTNNTGGAQPLTFTDIDATGKKNIEDAVALSKVKVAAAMADIAAARTGPQAKAAKYFKITGDKSSDDLKEVDAVVSVYSKVLTALSSSLKFEGEKPDGTTQAYVYTGFIGLFDGAVHIHFPGFNGETADERAAIIIHELSHKYGGTSDN